MTLVERPYVVDTIRYKLRGRAPGSSGEQFCSTTIAHRVQIFLSDGDTPPNTFDPVWTATVAESEDERAYAPFEHAIDPPVLVPEDNELFVSIEMAGSADGG